MKPAEQIPHIDLNVLIKGESAPQRIFGSGEMAIRTRAFPWETTVLGAVEDWPAALVITVNTLLGSRQPMFLWWGEELIQFYNDAYRPSLGIERHLQALGQRGRDCWPEIWNVIGPQIERVMVLGEATWKEDQLIPVFRNGRLEDIYWTYSYSPVRDSSGIVRGTLVACSETTGRVLAECALRVSREQYRSLFEAGPDAILVSDGDGWITEANQAGCELLGYACDDLLGRNYAEIFAKEDIPKLGLERESLLKGGTSVQEWQVLAKDGSEISAEISAMILPDGRCQAFVRDISRRKELEQERSLLILELQREWSRMADLFQQAPAFFAVLRGPEHIFEMTNPLYEQLVGVRQLIGQSVRDAIPEAEGAGFLRLLDGVYRTGEPFVGHGMSIKLVRGASKMPEERYVDFVYQPRREADNSVSGVIVLGVDVTEAKRSERALLQAEKIAAVGRLASSIAHEINNPLEAITNLLYLIEHTEEQEERVRYLAMAQDELGRVARITTQTLRFHRQSTKAGSTSLEKVLESVLTLNHGRLLSSRVSVEKRYRTEQPVLAYEADLRQVFANLVGNALDATAPGGRLVLTVQNAVDRVTGVAGVAVGVADTGSGMSKETLQHMFEPFFTTKGMTGTGLGLWVSSEILKNHRARVRVRSSQGRGTVFSIFFPLDAANQEQLPSAAADR